MKAPAPESQTHPCNGCRSWMEIDGELTCVNMHNWRSGVPTDPPCHVTEEAYAKAEHDIDEKMARMAVQLRELATVLPSGALLRMAKASAVDAKLQGDELLAAHYVAVGANLLAAHPPVSHAAGGLPVKAALLPKPGMAQTLKLVRGKQQ